MFFVLHRKYFFHIGRDQESNSRQGTLQHSKLLGALPNCATRAELWCFLFCYGFSACSYFSLLFYRMILVFLKIVNNKAFCKLENLLLCSARSLHFLWHTYYVVCKYYWGDLNNFLQPKGKASFFVYLLNLHIRYHFTTSL